METAQHHFKILSDGKKKKKKKRNNNDERDTVHLRCVCMLRNVSETGRGKETAASCKHRDITTFFLEIISRGVSSDGDLTACMHVYPPCETHTAFTDELGRYRETFLGSHGQMMQFSLFNVLSYSV